MKKLLLLILYSLPLCSEDSDIPTMIAKMKQALYILKTKSENDLSRLNQPDLDKKIQQLINMATEITTPQKAISFGELDDLEQASLTMYYKKRKRNIPHIICALWPIYEREVNSLM